MRTITLLRFRRTENVKLQKDTVLSLVKGATVFTNYLGACFESIQGVMLSISQPVAPVC